MKKLEEFSIRCGVDTCMIIYNRDNSSGRGPTIWPRIPERVKQVIDRYFSKGVDQCNKHAMDLREYFMSQKRKADKELAKVRSANWAAKYPGSEDLLNGLSQDQLQMVLSVLRMKLEIMKKRHLAAKESAVMNALGMVPMQMDDFKYDTPVHSHMNDYMPG
ncbi:agamous-like MADS-box protein AGL82 [Punica granatum]|nr:agamous-like MADS-box protein AGL82 [Punica granatum]